MLHVHDVSRFVSTLLPQFMSNESYDIAMSCQREAGLDVRRRLASRYELATKAFKNDSGERHLFGYDVTSASLESLERKEPRNRRTYGMVREEARLHVETRTGMKADDMDVVAFMKTNRQHSGRQRRHIHQSHRRFFILTSTVPVRVTVVRGFERPWWAQIQHCR